MCGFFEVFESCYLSSLSSWFVVYLVFPCVFLGQVFFHLFCFVVCVFFSYKRATSSANLKFVRFSPSTLSPLEMSAFLKTSSVTTVIV